MDARQEGIYRKGSFEILGMGCDLGRLFVLVLSTAVADFGGFTRIADR